MAAHASRRRVLLTGSAGTIGTVLRAGLPATFTEFDLPERDTRDYERLLALGAGHDAVVHLAWSTDVDNAFSGVLDPDNIRAADNVYRAALALGIPRVIAASSVYADDFANPARMLRTDTVPWPTSPYGAAKCAVEALGRSYSRQGLEVVCVRFGAVNPDDRAHRPAGAKVWLASEDCVALVAAVLSAATVPGRYACVYAVSDNEGRVHCARHLEPVRLDARASRRLDRRRLLPPASPLTARLPGASTARSTDPRSQS